TPVTRSWGREPSGTMLLSTRRIRAILSLAVCIVALRHFLRDSTNGSVCAGAIGVNVQTLIARCSLLEVQ
ncbi:MAG: hypothetical protein M3008_08610, partial [Chloroflexota bacterium]|nr:hypothetical protein [Chloroflexota bacterium]